MSDVEPRLRLLRWMAAQEFALIASELLPALERIVVEDHAALHRDLLGEPWMPPMAYRWIRYEDPEPVRRLIEATLRLERRWAELQARPGAREVRERAAALEARRLEAALRLARGLGFGGPAGS